MRHSPILEAAKMVKGLVYRIVSEGLRRGWFEAGQTIVDPFFGIGSTGIACSAHGLMAFGCELEPRFVELAKANRELHRADWERLGLPVFEVVQGDSRNLASIVREAAGCVTSPPYVDSMQPFGAKSPEVVAKWYESYRAQGGGMSLEKFSAHVASGRRTGMTDYGHTAGQLGAMPVGKPIGAITSPPYANRVDDSGTGPIAEKNGRYGQTEGQIGNLRYAGITSPPFSQPEVRDRYAVQDGSVGDAMTRAHTVDRQTQTPGNVAALPMGSVTSPPWENQEPTRDDAFRVSGRPIGSTGDHYGTAEGQVAHMPSGKLSIRNAIGYTYSVCHNCLLAKIAEHQSQGGAVGAGPAHAPTLAPPSREGRSPTGGKRRSPQRTSTSPTPTSTQSAPGTGRVEQTSGGGTPGGFSDGQCLSETDTPARGQGLTKEFLAFITAGARAKLAESGTIPSITSLPSAGVVTPAVTRGACIFCNAKSVGRATNLVPGTRVPVLSLVSESSSPKHTTAGCGSSRLPKTGRWFALSVGSPSSAAQPSEARYAVQNAAQSEGENTTFGDDPNSYWGACAVIYRQLWELFSPGSHAAIVVKSYVKNGAIVDLPSMTLALLESIGFEPVSWINAMLVAEHSQTSMLSEVPEKRKERKSFFRRLYEKKYPQNAIDAEVVLVVKRPGEQSIGYAAVTSPPFQTTTSVVTHKRFETRPNGLAFGMGASMKEGYGTSPGQIGAMRDGRRP